MRNVYFFFLCSLLMTNLVISQSYSSNFKSDICDCFQDEFSKSKRAFIAYDKCFKKALPSYAALIDAELSEVDVNKKFAEGQKARKELKERFQVELIYSCDLYYLAKEEELKKLIAKGVLESSIADLEKLNQNVAMYPNSTSYFFRGRTHFFLGNLDEAEADVRESINLTKDNDNIYNVREQTAFLAFILGEQERYSESKSLYAKVYETTTNIEAAIYRALIDRRSGSRNASFNVSKNINTKASRDRNAKSRTESDASQRDSENSSDLRKLFKLDDQKKKKNNQ